MRRLAAYLVAAVCLAAVVWAVSFGTLPPADFTFCNGDEIKSVDPALVTGQPAGRIIDAMFEGLIRWNPKTLEAEPAAAESWDISDDKLTYTFHLRGDAVWSDGSGVTAHNFAWSWRRFLHPETGSQYAFELWYIVGAKKYTTGAVEIGDPVEVELAAKPAGALPHASGIIERGKLTAIEGEKGSDSAIYVIEIDGRTRRFQKQPAGDGVEPYKWLIYDFEHVGIRAVDDRTLRVRLRHPVPYFLELMGFYPLFPVHRRCVETHGYPAWTKPENIVSNGPFLLEFRRIRDRIRLRKNPLYWDANHVKLNVVDALAVSSYPTMLNLYMTGQADWITVVPTEVIPDLLKRPERDFRPAPYLSIYYYTINTTKPPLGDVRVRRALALALDKREIVEKITKAGQAPARSFVPEEISKWMDYTPAPCGEHDPARARRLLAEAGYGGARGCPKIEILYNTSDTHKAIAELIQSQWKRSLGIDVGLRNQEWAVFLDSLRNKRFQIARSGWNADYVDPNTFLTLFVTGGAQNHTGWGNPEYDRLVETAQREKDESKRLEIFHRAERILMDEMPIIPIYFYVSQSMVRPYVKGYYRNALDYHPLRAIWIDKHSGNEATR